jgi:carbonic anhydrase
LIENCRYSEEYKARQEGNDRFAADKPSKREVGTDRRKELAKGQHPFAVVLTCADSRVAPELIFDAGLGELFVLRVAGNIADPAVVGSIEYAVEHLHAPLIVVLGHESCGAVAAALDGKPLPGDLGWLVKQVKVGDKLPDAKDDRLLSGIRNNVLAASADIRLRSKVIHEEVAHKKVVIVPAVYSLKSGKVEWIAPPEKKPAPASDAPSASVPSPAPVPGAEVPRFPRLQTALQRLRSR